MKSALPTFFLLNGALGWRMQDQAGMAVGKVDAIRLPGDPDGLLLLNSPDGSLGGLSLPRGMAIDGEERIWLLGLTTPWIKRFDPGSMTFKLLSGIGGEGADARKFRQPTNIAIAGDNLYVADTGNGRFQVFALPSLALRYVWNIGGTDVAARGNTAWLLDGVKGRVCMHRAGTDGPSLFMEAPPSAEGWSRIVLDRQGGVYLLDAAQKQLWSFTQQRFFSDPSQLQGEFDDPAIRMDFRQRFCIPPSLARLCRRQLPTTPEAPELPLAPCPPRADGTVVPCLFDRDGNPITRDFAESPGHALYQKEAQWFTLSLDSDIPRCQWHRIELSLAALPPGTRVTVSTFCAEQMPGFAMITDPLREHLWATRFSITGPMQAKPGASTAGVYEFLVQSRAGRFLVVRLSLSGDGYNSPAVDGLRVHYPRQSYLAYLPGVYQSDDEGSWFLQRYLSIAQTEWDGLENRIRSLAALFDPKAVPAGAALEFLAQWLALPQEGTWNDDQKRTLLEAAPVFYKARGTVASLRSYVRAYLENISGVTSDQMAYMDYPQIVEDFRARRYMMLDREGAATLGGLPLWSAGVVGRMQLGVFSTVGGVRMVSLGDPEHDLFQQFAHRFHVFAPAAWVRTANDEQKLRRALESEKPAHTAYTLCLVEPRCRVGVQSTVGVDTIIAAMPAARLGCYHDSGEAPSHQPHSRLNYDMVLTRKPSAAPVLQLQRGARVGANSKLN